jgi:molybdate transport system ATP-binding protein
MSSSEQRLILIARALVKHPRILALDELCQGLDTVSRRRILELLDRLASEGDVTLIVVAHRAKDLPSCITHVLHLSDGHASIWQDLQNLPKDL